MQSKIALALGLFLGKIWKHFTNWLEVYFWIPLAIVGIFASAHLAYILTGYKPHENADWIVGFAQRLVACVLVIALVSVTREQTGFWMTKEESFVHVKLAITQKVVTCFFAALFAYILLH